MNKKQQNSICTISVDAENGSCGFVLNLNKESGNLQVRNLDEIEMARILRQMALDLPLHLENAAKNIEAQNTVVQTTGVH